MAAKAAVHEYKIKIVIASEPLGERSNPVFKDCFGPSGLAMTT
jgi:hypothetical protein